MRTTKHKKQEIHTQNKHNDMRNDTETNTAMKNTKANRLSKTKEKQQRYVPKTKHNKQQNAKEPEQSNKQRKQDTKSNR